MSLNLTKKRVLDPASGSRMMWFDRGHPDALFGDRRRETLTVTDRSHGRPDGTRTLTVDPDMLMDFRALPFEDCTFRLVAFDPPHLVRAGTRSWLAAKYGKPSQDWRDDLRQGFAESFRVLHPDGVLVFKWNETQVKLREVLELTPHQPLQHLGQEVRHALDGVHEARHHGGLRCGYQQPNPETHVKLRMWRAGVCMCGRRLTRRAR